MTEKGTPKDLRLSADEIDREAERKAMTDERTLARSERLEELRHSAFMAIGAMERISNQFCQSCEYSPHCKGCCQQLAEHMEGLRKEYNAQGGGREV